MRHFDEFWHKKPWRRHALMAVIAMNLFALFLAPSQAFAQLVDPFASTGEWVSFDAFLENQDKEPAVIQEPALVSPDPKADAEVKAAAELEKAPPERALNYPVMPSARDASALSVKSTEEEGGQMFQEKKSWLGFDEAEVESEKEEQAERLRLTLDPSLFKVRFATLPRPDFSSIPSARVTTSQIDKDKKSLKAREPAPVTAASPEKKKEQAEACEAMSEIRKRQLEAMESDRQTLSALKNALTDLGLVDKLSFMTSSQSLLSEGASSAQATKTGDVTQQSQTASP